MVDIKWPDVRIYCAARERTLSMCVCHSSRARRGGHFSNNVFVISISRWAVTLISVVVGREIQNVRRYLAALSLPLSLSQPATAAAAEYISITYSWGWLAGRLEKNKSSGRQQKKTENKIKFICVNVVCNGSTWLRVCVVCCVCAVRVYDTQRQLEQHTLSIRQSSIQELMIIVRQKKRAKLSSIVARRVHIFRYWFIVLSYL